jgi:hypothetical protein
MEVPSATDAFDLHEVVRAQFDVRGGRARLDVAAAAPTMATWMPGLVRTQAMASRLTVMPRVSANSASLRTTARLRLNSSPVKAVASLRQWPSSKVVFSSKRLVSSPLASGL